MTIEPMQCQPRPDDSSARPLGFVGIARFMIVVAVVASVASCNRGPREVRLDVIITDGQLEKRELYVPADTQVAITLRNRDAIRPGPGGEPRGGQRHNFVLVQPGAALSPKPADIIAQSPMIDPGQRATFRFSAPSPGNYEFLCSGPEHKLAQNGQPSTVLRGKFVVQ